MVLYSDAMLYIRLYSPESW